jgi:hypothetical protein
MESYTKYIRDKTGMSFTEFCKKCLNQDIREFRQRLKSGKIKISDASYIINVTGKDFNELFMNPKRSPKKSIYKPPKKTKKDFYFIFD